MKDDEKSGLEEEGQDGNQEDEHSGSQSGQDREAAKHPESGSDAGEEAAAREQDDSDASAIAGGERSAADSGHVEDEPEKLRTPRERSGKVVQLRRDRERTPPDGAATSETPAGERRGGGKVVQLRPKPAVPVTDADSAGDPFDPDSDAFWEEDEDEELTEAQEKRRRRIKRFILIFLALALLGNVIAFWPQIYNRETLPFLFNSRELSQDEQIQIYKQAVVQIGTDQGKGTGFLIPEGYIVTNHHIIEERTFQRVQFSNEPRTYPATVVATDLASDLAILRLEEEVPNDLTTLTLSDQGWNADMPVHIIGNPLYFSGIVSQGTVMGEMQLSSMRQPVLALDAPVFQGNSGSPVIDEEGRVTAVVFATTNVTVDEEEKKIGLAIPVDRVHRLLNGLAGR
ncbi:trypsin-like peptidase domain-containing protein [Paenibacillus sp. 1P07SE]|uniref:trypsin-like peptidase domain-containing protein n=1 Tax=Paenibacillus sp. 1P07SE TaxID=3132209 RepID=UPI0039A572A7